ncbi:MAG: hypothetical protein SPE79_06500, partial [Sodaliphilus sp.]|nr:hypothetical protein [Sodaliphilus sp.]
QVNERVGVGLSNYRIIEFSKFRNFGLVEFWSGAVVGKKIVGVVGLLYLCGLIGEMCAQLFCISGMGAN